jgi:ubiquitin carboxyl-terminal hydrolase 5/13
MAKKIDPESLSKCYKCDLRKNLWLNLQTGVVGCGRKQPDGSGGQQHAIDHAKEVGCHLVVKQGTIKPDGSASLYCYKCDDDVKDPYLAEHLATFGIDIAR